MYLEEEGLKERAMQPLKSRASGLRVAHPSKEALGTVYGLKAPDLLQVSWDAAPVPSPQT